MAVEMNKSGVTLGFCFKALNTAKTELISSSQMQLLLSNPDILIILVIEDPFPLKWPLYNTLLSRHSALSPPPPSHVDVIYKLEIVYISSSSLHITSWTGNSPSFSANEFEKFGTRQLKKKQEDKFMLNW